MSYLSNTNTPLNFRISAAAAALEYANAIAHEESMRLLAEILNTKETVASYSAASEARFHAWRELRNAAEACAKMPPADLIFKKEPNA